MSVWVSINHQWIPRVQVSLQGYLNPWIFLDMGQFTVKWKPSNKSWLVLQVCRYASRGIFTPASDIEELFLDTIQDVGSMEYESLGFSLNSWSQIRQDYPLNLSILISGGKETNRDSLSNGEWSGNSSNLKSLMRIVVCRDDLDWQPAQKSSGMGHHGGWESRDWPRYCHTWIVL